MAEIKNVERYRKEYQHLTDVELTNQMHSWVPHSEMHIAAKIVLSERRAKHERLRFHLIFWLSLIAAIAGVVAAWRGG